MSKQKGKENKNKKASFFQDRADELNQLYQILFKCFKNDAELGSLQKAAQKLEEQANGSETLEDWGYKIENLVLPVGDIRNVEPAGVPCRLKLECVCQSKVDDFNKGCDPFTNYSFRLEIYGEYEGMKYSWCMHIDKEAPNDSDEWHPLYHLHCFDGRGDMRHALKDEDKKRGMMYLNVPRFVHYPLDIVLAIGFCLMNFHKKEVFNKLYLHDVVFPRLYKRSRERILEPFFEAIVGNRGGRKPGWLERKDLCPQIV